MPKIQVDTVDWFMLAAMSYNTCFLYFFLRDTAPSIDE